MPIFYKNVNQKVQFLIQVTRVRARAPCSFWKSFNNSFSCFWVDIVYRFYLDICDGILPIKFKIFSPCIVFSIKMSENTKLFLIIFRLYCIFSSWEFKVLRDSLAWSALVNLLCESLAYPLYVMGETLSILYSDWYSPHSKYSQCSILRRVISQIKVKSTDVVIKP